jgi:hypothetical protein
LRGDEIRACWEEGTTLARAGGGEVAGNERALPVIEPRTGLWADIDA